MQGTSDNTRILQRIKASYASTYLTLISIIQGAAFAYLATTVDMQPGRFSLAYWVLVGNTSLLIVEGWDEYVIGITTFVWVPNVIDALLPFALGGAEVFTIGSLRTLSSWLLGTALLAFIGLLAFINLYTKARREQDENGGILKVLRFHIFTGHLFAFLGFVLCLVLWQLAIRVGNGNSLPLVGKNAPLVLALCASPLILAFFIRSIVYWQSVIAYARGEISGDPPRSEGVGLGSRAGLSSDPRRED
jgi:hypothetical protein